MEDSTELIVENSTGLPVQVDGLKGLVAPTGDSGFANVLDRGGAKEVVIRNQTAAVEVQRSYRGYRARRSIADAATMAHKFGWWNVVEGAVLDYNSSQFYAYNTPQNAAQRWLRLKKKAAKVGKGLSKNEKARKLALQHWLEAIDPRHRYGHNLHFYYDEWVHCNTEEPFFYWLDVGEGKDLDLKGDCKRSKLQKEMIRYMSPKERKWYEVVIKDGKLMQRMTGELVNTPKGHKWIFVMSTTGQLYVGKKERGRLQHSSFLAGGATTAAGRLNVKDGVIQLLEAHSGHYHPTEANFHELINVLKGNGADLTVAKVNFVSDDMINSSSNSITSCGAAEAREETCDQDVPATTEAGQKLECNNGAAEARDETCEQDVPVASKAAQKLECNNGAAKARDETCEHDVPVASEAAQKLECNNGAAEARDETCEHDVPVASEAAQKLECNNGATEARDKTCEYDVPVESEAAQKLECNNGAAEARDETCEHDVPVASEAAQKLECNNRATEARDKTCKHDVPVESEAAQKLECNNEDSSARELEVLPLEDEQNACSVDKVTLMEGTVCRGAPNTGYMEVEGHQLLEFDDSFDGSDENLWKSIEGMMMVEVVKPGELSKWSQDETAPIEGEVDISVQDATTAKSSSKCPPRNPISHHRLFGPALQAFSRLEGRPCTSCPDLNGATSENIAELTPNSKLLLLQRLSLMDHL